MNKLAILLVVGMALALSNCANNTPSTVTNTSTSGNWEAQLIEGTGQASLLSFVVTFSVTNSGPLDIVGFGFFNQGQCFATGLNQQTEKGSAAFTTNTTGQVTGTLNLTVTSSTTGSVLSLSGQLTGRSNGTTTTTGTLSNGVVVGTWTLTNSSIPACNTPQGASPTFIMCQGTATCSTAGAAEQAVEKL
jgi:hypothetical protein